jgi:hypothetical protein
VKSIKKIKMESGKGLILEFILCRDALRRLEIENNLIALMALQDFAATTLRICTSIPQLQEEGCAFINIFFIHIFHHTKNTLDNPLLKLIKSSLASNNTMTTKNAIHTSF